MTADLGTVEQWQLNARILNYGFTDAWHKFADAWHKFTDAWQLHSLFAVLIDGAAYFVVQLLVRDLVLLRGGKQIPPSMGVGKSFYPPKFMGVHPSSALPFPKCQ